jgi:hypothetical protein
VNATVRALLFDEPHVRDTAAEFSRAAEVLSVACRSWQTLPPTNRAEVDAVANQVEGVRRGLIELRSRFQT